MTMYNKPLTPESCLTETAGLLLAVLAVGGLAVLTVTHVQCPPTEGRRVTGGDYEVRVGEGPWQPVPHESERP